MNTSLSITKGHRPKGRVSDFRRPKGWIILGVPAFFTLVYIASLSETLLELPVCAVKLFAGFDCPGCGLIHSIASLLRADIRRSIDYHPLGVFISLYLVAIFLKTAVNGQKTLSHRGRDAIIIGFTTALFIQWFAKIILG